MGGYAALTYADIIGAHRVLAINPQSTLHPGKSTWEKRFGVGRALDWSGPHSDAIDGFTNVEKAYVVVDRMHDDDWQHVKRLPKGKLEILNVPFVCHELSVHLHEMKILRSLAWHLINNTLSANWFASEVRKRRNLKRYFNTLTGHPRVTQSPLLASIVEKYREKSALLGVE